MRYVGGGGCEGVGDGRVCREGGDIGGVGEGWKVCREGGEIRCVEEGWSGAKFSV